MTTIPALSSSNRRLLKLLPFPGKTWLFPLCSVIAIWGASLDSPAQVYQLNDGFESGSLKDSWFIENSPADASNVTVEKGITRAGDFAVHLVNHYSDPDGARLRTEMTAQSQGEIVWEREYWIGFSFYLKDWSESTYPEIVQQFHAVPHNRQWATNVAARNITSLWVESGQLNLSVITHPNAGPAAGAALADKVWSEPVKPNTWYDWVIHLLPSQGGQGIIEVWRNGQKIYHQEGPNVDIQDSVGQMAEPYYYLKCGVYNWPWGSGKHDVDLREIIYDEVRIGCVQSGYTSGYEGVMPASAEARK